MIHFVTDWGIAVQGTQTYSVFATQSMNYLSTNAYLPQLNSTFACLANSSDASLLAQYTDINPFTPDFNQTVFAVLKR